MDAYHWSDKLPVQPQYVLQQPINDNKRFSVVFHALLPLGDCVTSVWFVIVDQ